MMEAGSAFPSRTGEKAAVQILRPYRVPTHFFKIDRRGLGDIRGYRVEPSAEAQIAHAAAVVTARTKRDATAFDRRADGAACELRSSCCVSS